MRIDLTPPSMPDLDRSGSSATTAKAGSGSSVSGSSEGNDSAQLSTGSDAVQALQKQLESVPDGRQERVSALRQAMSDGSFQVSPARIAEAMLDGGMKAR